MRGEIDARATSADTVLRRNPDWIEKGLVDFHAIIEVPKGEKHSTFPHVPELESFARSEKDRKINDDCSALSGLPVSLSFSPARRRIAPISSRKHSAETYKDPEFHKEYKKLTADDATPLMPDAHEQVIKQIPRDPEVVGIFKKLHGAEPLPR